MKIHTDPQSRTWLERTNLLLGDDKLLKIRQSHVLIVGLGGVGAYAAEMIARAGVERLTIADADVVAPSNINRQLIATTSSIGRSKALLMADRLLDINPLVELTVVEKYIKDELTDQLLDSAKFDYVVDAIDTLSPKVALIKGALERGFPLVSSMGSGAKTDPTQVEITDIGRTHHCPLAHMLRKRLHRIGVRSGFHAVFSAEPVREGAMIVLEDEVPGGNGSSTPAATGSVAPAEPNKKSNVGTISYMPAVFGCACASVVLRGLIGEM